MGMSEAEYRKRKSKERKAVAFLGSALSPIATRFGGNGARLITDVATGAEEGHKTAGLFLGAEGASGATAKDTGESLYAPAAAGMFLGGAANSLSHGTHNPEGAIYGGLENLIAGSIRYGAGEMFGHKYSKREKDKYHREGFFVSREAKERALKKTKLKNKGE